MNLLPVCLREFSSVEFRYCKDLALVSSSLSAHPPARARIFPLLSCTSIFFHSSSLLQSPSSAHSLSPHSASPVPIPSLAHGAAKPRVRAVEPQKARFFVTEPWWLRETCLNSVPAHWHFSTWHGQSDAAF